MKSIRLQNIRCLKDTGFVELKPLTIIIGENSSGKSTFARMFPLFKQSVLEKPQGPVLFYGELVDFGNIKNFRTKGSDEKHIEISFKFNANLSDLVNRFAGVKIIDTEIGISIGENTNNIPCVNNIEIKFHSYHLNFKMDSFNSIVVTANGMSFQKQVASLIALDDGEIIPSFMDKLDKPSSLTGHLYDPLGKRERFNSKLSIPKALLQEATNIVMKYNRSTVKEERINIQLIQLANIVLLGGDFISQLSNISAATSHWKNKTGSNLSLVAQQDFYRLEKILSIYVAFRLMNNINLQYKNIASNVKYIAPIRATAERYYRTRNISVSEVDFRGENLAMYISSLYSHQLSSLKEWLKTNFKMELDVKKDEGHISLHLKHVASENLFNMTDMGFGFSQIIPILVQLWSLINNIRKTTTNHPLIYVIEQPELHLHPRMQGVIASIFCDAIKISKENNMDIRLIIETHSESIINKVGKKISEEKLLNDDVNIVIFDKNKNDTYSNVRISSFKENGQLENWPWGFFD